MRRYIATAACAGFTLCPVITRTSCARVGIEGTRTNPLSSATEKGNGDCARFYTVMASGGLAPFRRFWSVRLWTESVVCRRKHVNWMERSTLIYVTHVILLQLNVLRRPHMPVTIFYLCLIELSFIVFLLRIVLYTLWKMSKNLK